MDADRGLSWPQMAGCLALVLAVFVLWSGPVWRDPWHVDGAAWASYAPIPALVLACLLWSRRFSLRWWAVDTIVLTGMKFAVTYTLATALWIASDPPARPVALPRTYRTPADAAPPPPPSPVVPTRVVTGVAGPGAIVYVSVGVDDLVFLAPAEPVVLTFASDAITPRVAVAQVHQRIELRSGDGRLHTFVGESPDQRWFNRAAPGDGTPATVVMTEPAGVLTVYSRLEPDGPRATLLVLSHPYWTVADATGHYELPVPHRNVELATLP